MAMAPWVSGGVSTWAASKPPEAKASSAEATGLASGSRRASASAAPRRGSATATTETSGILASTSAWMRAIFPAPTKQISSHDRAPRLDGVTARASELKRLQLGRAVEIGFPFSCKHSHRLARTAETQHVAVSVQRPDSERRLTRAHADSSHRVGKRRRIVEVDLTPAGFKR